MRILRVVNISIKTLAITVLAVSSTAAISSPVIAQSFDYPANSPTVFNRGTQQPALPAAAPSSQLGINGSGLPSMQQMHQDISSKPSVFSKLFPRKKSDAPVFESPFESTFEDTTATDASSYRAGGSVFVDPYAQQLLDRHANQSDQTQTNQANVRHANGYQPTHQRSQIQRVNFNQHGGNKPHSILERPDYLQTSTTKPSVAGSAKALSPPVRTSTATTTPSEKKTESIVAAPVAKVAQRVSIPDNAFTQEFEKAYRYINPTSTQDKNRPPRTAKADDASREISLDSFSDRTRNQPLSSDFTPDNPLAFETPPFIRPEPSEQSPNASAPDFNPPKQSGDFDTLSLDTLSLDTPPLDTPPIDTLSESTPELIPEFTPQSTPEGAPEFIPEFTISAPAKTSERALIDALKANEIEGDFEDTLGSVDQWQPPKASENKQTLEEELAELSKPLVRSKPTDTQSTAPTSVVSAFSFDAFDQSPIWWKQQVNQPLHPENQAVPVNSNALVFAALKNSPRIQAVSKNPLIRELQVVEADAEFDPVRFVQSQFQDRVDPVGSSLTINDNLTEQFLKENTWTAEAGIRRRLRTGADLRVSQRLGFQNSNSNNFIPQDQGTATLALNVTQPLLRGRGRVYNQAQILIAQSTGGVAWEVFQQELQEELEGVVAAYWQLYLERSVYLQRKRNVQRGQVILDRLNGRRELDSLPAQIARARSSVQTRKTELANAFRNIRNAETEIRRRVADRNWMASQSLELLPEELPSVQNVGWDLDQVVQTALNHRPEIRESMRRIKIAGVQRDVSENELLPELSFLVGTYVSALRGDSDVLGAFGDQFGQVTPGYSFGLEYELPRLNRAARSRFQQRHLQFKRLENELEEVIQNVIAESQIALRRITSAIETLAAAEQAIVAARADLNQNQTRWESFALVEGDIAEGLSPTTVLDQLLDSQERLSQAEIVYAQAELELKISEVSLQRSMGTLLMHQQVSYDRHVVGDTPQVQIQKQQ